MNEDRSNFIELIDNQDSRVGNRPPSTGTFVPDLVWMRLDNTFRYIGEAKTRHDIHNEHTRNQLIEYLRIIESQDFGELVLAVPLGSEKTSCILLENIVLQEGFLTSKWHVISKNLQ